MTDYEKLIGLKKRKLLKGTNTNIFEKIKVMCAEYLVEEYSNFKLEEDNYFDGKLYVSSETIKEEIKDFEHLEIGEHNFYTTVYNDIGNFFIHRINRRNEPSYQNSTILIKNEDDYHPDSIRLIKRAISELAKINIKSLSAKTEKEFETHLKLKFGHYENLDDYFFNFRLEKQLNNLKFNSSIKQIKDFKKSLKLPKYINTIEEINFKEKKIKNTLFIEGFAGSGKSTLIQNLAYKLNREDVFYIDLKEDEAKELINKDIALFLKEIQKAKDLLIIDNIQHTDKILRVAEKFLLESLNIDFPIIISSQKFIYKDDATQCTKDILFKDITKELKDKIKFIDLTNTTIAISLTKSLLKYHNIENKKQYPIAEDLAKDLNEKFGGNISYINFSLAVSNDIKNLNMSKFRKYIKEEYAELLSMNDMQEFKLLLLYTSSMDYTFQISKDLYYDENLDLESSLIEKLVPTQDNKKEVKSKNLLFKFENEKTITLVFPHNTIAKYLIELISKKRNIYKLLIDSLQEIKIFDPKLYEIFFHALYFTPTLESKSFIKIYNNIAKKTSLSNFLTLKSILLILKCNSIARNKDILASQVDEENIVKSLSTLFNIIPNQLALVHQIVENNDTYANIDNEIQELSNILSTTCCNYKIRRIEQFENLINKENVEKNIDDLFEFIQLSYIPSFHFIIIKILKIVFDEKIIIPLSQLLSLEDNIKLLSKKNDELNYSSDVILHRSFNHFLENGLYKNIPNIEKFIVALFKSSDIILNDYITTELYEVFKLNKTTLEKVLLIQSNILSIYKAYPDISLLNLPNHSLDKDILEKVNNPASKEYKLIKKIQQIQETIKKIDKHCFNYIQEIPKVEGKINKNILLLPLFIEQDPSNTIFKNTINYIIECLLTDEVILKNIFEELPNDDFIKIKTFICLFDNMKNMQGLFNFTIKYNI